MTGELCLCHSHCCHIALQDGFEASALIRSFEKAHALPRKPIIAATADVTNDKEACLLAGIDAVLQKPFTAKELEVALVELSQTMAAGAGAGAR